MILAALAGALLLAPGTAASGAAPPAVVFTGPDERATVALPPGWVVGQHRPDEELLLVRPGPNTGAQEPSIRVRVEARPPGEEDTIRDLVFDRFERPRVWGTLGPSIWTADERHLWWVEHFVADDGQPSQVVTFVVEPSRLVVFTLEAFSLKSLHEWLPDFTALVASYRRERTDPRGRLLALWNHKHVTGAVRFLAAPAFIIGFWSGLWWLLALVGGWPFLARAYRARGGFNGPRTGWVHGFVGGTGYKVMTVGADGTGLYVKIPFFLRPGHAPLFFPWSEVQDVTTIRGNVWTSGPKLVFRFRRSRVDVKLPPDLAEWLEEQAGPAWPRVR